ncbi:PAS domain-containing sensor histidine kinase [Sneathiella chinensis]|uniref:PAS domain-containing sensor histidine kinase n=1 Tax=Sneathiella chinensis TaxID=349750 RepID=UPI00146E7614|nr:ATP-binding protein [Sneathiella chinensis]
MVHILRQKRELSRIRSAYRLLCAGLALTSLNALNDILLIGPNRLATFSLYGAEGERYWDIFGYLPGLALVFLGVARFLPAVAQLNREIEGRKSSEEMIKRQTADLRIAKQHAEKAERLLMEAIESISDAFIIFDNEDRVVAFNRQYAGLFEHVDDILRPGVTFEELIRHQATMSGYFQDEEASEEWIQKRLEEHRQPGEPREQVFPNGRIYRLSEFKTVSGGVVALRTDITELREREQSIRQINQRLEEAQSVAHIGNWIHDYRTGTYEWSQETNRIMGYDGDNLETTYEVYLSRVHPDDMERMKSVVSWAAEKGENYQVEYRMIKPSGDVVHVLEIGQIHLDENGKPAFVNGTIQDVTAQHQVEAELLDAKVRAEEGTKAKSLFLANMSHELRTPLNAVIGFAEVIQQEMFGPVGSPRYKQYAENIHSSGQHLLSLINDVLDFSRLEAGQEEIRKEPIKIEEIISWTSMMLASKAEEKKISLDVAVDKRLVIQGDLRKLRQVMINLVNNALKFTAEGGRISIRTNTDSDNYFSILVRDNGCGISEAEIRQVMRPFGRTSSSVSKSIEGTGLGLPLSKSIVEMHDGEMRIESEVGKGTTVEIRLPRRLTEAPEKMLKKTS